MTTRTERPLVVDLYSGPGGVGIALDKLGVNHIGVDIEDYGGTYPGEFLQGDASDLEFIKELPSPDVLWMSPPCQAYSRLSYVHYDNPRDHNPTFDDLNVREVIDLLDPDEYIIENVALCDDLRAPTRINGFGVGLPFGLERWFETSFPAPDRVSTGVAETGIFTKGTGDFRSKKSLARAKSVPETWTEQQIRSAMPREYVEYLFHYCPALDVPHPSERPRQGLLTEVA